MTYCSNCGAKYLEDARFCVDCGRAITIGSAKTITNGAENTSEEQLIDLKLEAEDKLEGNDDSVGVTDKPKLTELRTSLHGTENNVSKLKRKHKGKNKKILLILLGIILLVGSLVFFIWNNSSKEPEVWRSTQSDNYLFSINATINDNRYLAELIPKTFGYMEPYEINNKIILEGEMVPTNNPNSQQVKLETMSLELNDILITEIVYELSYELTYEFYNDGNIIVDALEEFKKNLTMDSHSKTTKEKKALLAQYSTELFKVIKSDYGDATSEKLRLVKELEKYIQEIIANVYEVDGGLGIKISLTELKEIVMLVATINDTSFYDSQEILATINAVESLVKFELTNETSAFVSMPFTNERLFLKKEIEFR